MIRLWVCQVRKEAFVGGESQRCRHTLSTDTFRCGVMELIGGEPLEFCVVHGEPLCACGYPTSSHCAKADARNVTCQFVSQVRVGP